jgi:hypothetical protein
VAWIAVVHRDFEVVFGLTHSRVVGFIPCPQHPQKSPPIGDDFLNASPGAAYEAKSYGSFYPAYIPHFKKRDLLDF